MDLSIMNFQKEFQRALNSKRSTLSDSLVFGNRGLCGPTLLEKCPGDVTSNTTTNNGGSKNYQEDGDEFLKCLYAGLGLGFIVGFWGVCGSLILTVLGDMHISY
jgi:EIX receptor 1/2